MDAPLLAQALLSSLLLGTIAGLAAGLLGIGGGLILVPALLWLLPLQGVPPELAMHLALGTSLASIVFTSLSSITAHQRHEAILWPVVTKLTPGILLGALLGAVLADHLGAEPLRKFFGLFELFVATQMLANLKPSPHRSLPGTAGSSVAGSTIGLLSSLLGIGGGTLTVPFLHYCNVPIRRAIATSAACGLPIAVAGTLGFIFAGYGQPGLPGYTLGYLHLPTLPGLVIASVATAPVGAKLTHSLPVPVVKKLFAALLLVLAYKMLKA